MGVANISGNILTDSGASLSSYLPLTGGTLTGALNGTSASFSSSVTATSEFISITGFNAKGNGSDTAAVSPYYLLSNTAGNRQWILQLGASNEYRLHYYNGTSWSNPFTIASTGAATFSSSVTANGLRLNGGDTTNTIYAGSASMGITAEAGYNISIGRVSDTTKALNVNTTNGNVGIGTSSPSALLTVAGTVSIGNTMTVGNQGGVDTTVITGGSGFGSKINFNSPSGVAAQITGNTDSFVNRFTGNFGIGTISPSAKLHVDGNAIVSGSLSKGSGSFRIDHPLESMSETHQLVHSFVESPQANNIYRGKVQLINGKAEVNLDEVSTMTEGTFVLLNRDIHTYTSNETDWDAVRGKVDENILTIECENNQSSAMVSWLVIGERQDKHMMDTEWTDGNGKVIVEPLKEDAKVTALENK